MYKWINALTKIVLSILIFANIVHADSIKTVVVKEEKPSYLMDIKYPQGFTPFEVDILIKEYITATQKSFLSELKEDEDTPADAPGKTALNVTYSILYNAKTALSLRFEVSIFHKGAAHPINTIVVHNFLKGKKVTLADLFIPGADYLKLIARYCKKSITQKHISDRKWIQEGTKATLENYSVWYFTNKGIGIIFNTYQVAAYVYGAQAVEIPFTYLSAQVKPELAHSLWSN